MAKLVGKSAPVSAYIGKSAAGADPKGGKLMPGSKLSSTGSGGNVPKPSRTKHGSSFIADVKLGK